MSKNEIETMIATAHAQRKAAYKARCPKFVTMHINQQIRDLNELLAKAVA